MTVEITPADPERLRAALDRRGLSVPAAAERLGVTRSAVHQILTGHRRPSLDWLHAAAVALDIDPAELDGRLASTRARKR
jgi:transcriptional regulator with XRE-family HTH domain